MNLQAIKGTFCLTLLLFVCVSLFAAYYDGATGTGENLKNQLHTIITNGHTALSYDGAKLKLFQNVFNVNSVVRCIYTGRDFTIASGYNGSSSPNTEHCFCQSWFGSADENTKKSDLHHLFPTQQNVNSSRGNIPYGIVANHATATTYESYNGYHSYRGANSLGQTVFEPADQYKGDIARALLYFSVRYNMGLTIDGIDMLPTCLQWADADTIDAFERTRNESSYTYQGNRNPFIDHPEWIDSIWESTGSSTTVSFSSDNASVYESYGTYYIPVQIYNPSPTASTTCNIALTSGDAASITNYSTQTITFPAGASATLSIPVQITDNQTIDGTRTLTFTIQNVSGGTAATVGTTSATNLQIVDNDFDEQGQNYANDLFISEYIEGSSSNKYIEIFNGTGSTVNLANYQLQLFSNGASSASNTFALSGNLLSNHTSVYRNTSAVLTLPAGVTATVSSAVNYSGDDALALVKVSPNQYVDIIGRIGERPSPAWTATGISTENQTLIRKRSVKAGVSTNPSSGFPTLGTEWTTKAQNFVDSLGSHDFNYGEAQSNADHQSKILVDTMEETYFFGNNTGIALYFNDLSGSDYVKIKKYDQLPNNLTYDTTPPVYTKHYHWVISTSGISSFNANMTINLNAISNPDLTNNTNAVKLYYRSTEGSGNFTLMGIMNYDNATNSLSMNGISAMGEWVLATETQTLPVTLSAFVASPNINDHSVLLQWTTQSENSMAGYEIFKNRTDNQLSAILVSPTINAINQPQAYTYQWKDESVANGTWYYWVKSIELNNYSCYYGPVVVNMQAGEPDSIPACDKTALRNIYPNPFNPTTTISYSLRDDSNVDLTIYNIKGAVIQHVSYRNKPAGLYTYTWSPRETSSGVYFVQLKTKDLVSVRKLVLIK